MVPVSSPTTPSATLDAPAGTRAAHFRLAVLALAVGGFTIGTTEFVTMGVLPRIADGVDVSIPVAGRVISAYALGVVIGAPLLAYFGAKLPRRQLLVGLMAAYALFNALSALAPNYETLMVARFLDGLPHGGYFGVASLVAASMVAPERRGRAGHRVGADGAAGRQRGRRAGRDVARTDAGLAGVVLGGCRARRARHHAGAGVRAGLPGQPRGDRPPPAAGAAQAAGVVRDRRRSDRVRRHVRDVLVRRTDGHPRRRPTGGGRAGVPAHPRSRHGVRQLGGRPGRGLVSQEGAPPPRSRSRSRSSCRGC